MKAFVLLCSAIALALLGGQAQSSRDRHADMTLVAVGPYNSPPSGGQGVLWSYTLKHADAASAIRVHVLVHKRRASPNWGIRFRDASGGDVESFRSDSPLLASGGIWSSEIPGNAAIVELVADDKGTELEIGIDRYAFRALTTDAPVADPSVVEIGSAPPQIQPWAIPVARLRSIQETGQYTCTGFLVAPQLLLTSRHCVSTNETALSAIADFRYDNRDAKTIAVRATKLEAASESLDYAFLRLDRAPAGVEPLTRFGSVAPPVGTSVVIVHHPEGGTKRVSIDCKVAAVALQGLAGGKTDFGYDCVTRGGSAGAPVFDRRNGDVVGIHHLGAAAPGGMKQAVGMGLVLDDLARVAPQLYRELRPATTTTAR